MITHQPYPSDVSDAEWAFVVPSGSPWRYLPKNFPPWQVVYQQSDR